MEIDKEKINKIIDEWIAKKLYSNKGARFIFIVFLLLFVLLIFGYPIWVSLNH